MNSANLANSVLKFCAAAAIATVFAVSANADSMRLYDSNALMDWDRSIEFCRSLNARLPSLANLEAAFRGSYRSLHGRAPYANDIYWTIDEIDFEGAYAYDFAAGLHIVDLKALPHRVMCIQTN
ncbi:hypothetical protein AGMMS50229_01820 [Campylobacterota bacterium]|nr:hypothetical protein AGMMS50229_01820 [Campylobacterota bacterium]